MAGRGQDRSRARRVSLALLGVALLVVAGTLPPLAMAALRRAVGGAPAPPPRGPAGADADRLVREAAGRLSAELAETLLGADALPGRIARAVGALSRGEVAYDALGFLRPAGAFAVQVRDAGPAVDPASYRRYDALADSVAFLDARRAAALYRELRPLLRRAWEEAGPQAGTLDEAVAAAIAELLAVPAPPGEVLLVRSGRRWRFADARLEALSPAQKLLLRAGPRNIEALQDALRRLRVELEADTRARAAR